MARLHVFILTCVQAMFLHRQIVEASRRVRLRRDSAAGIHQRGPGPRLFIAIFSSRGNAGRRNYLRDSLKHYGLKDGGDIEARFAVCEKTEGPSNGGGDGNAAAGTSTLNWHLRSESDEFNDMLFVDCHDGTARAQITRKLVEVMKVYRRRYTVSTMFVKVEDDTFVAWKRLFGLLGSKKNTKHLYMGMLMPEGRLVNRDAESPWYQPEDTYPKSKYPAYMDRACYLLGGALVERLMEDRIAQAMLLSNDDQAVGVWVDTLRQRGMPVERVPIAGRSAQNTIGQYGSDEQVSSMDWGSFPYVMYHGLKGDYISCLAEVDANGDADQQIGPCFEDSLYVAIFSARVNGPRRRLVRSMLEELRRTRGQRVVTEFVICGGNTDEMLKEQHEFGDLRFLDCEEGYNHRRLTLKLMKAMQMYRNRFANISLFMKVDDDTFVSWDRLRNVLAAQRDTDYSYMGVQAPQGMPVNRDINSAWYQPPDVYPNDTYPLVMEGGPGYIMGKELVNRILHNHIADNAILANEDQAAGVWVETLKQHGAPVKYVAIRGTDGYRPEFDVCFGMWGDYPYVLHHHLQAEAIVCLAKVDSQHDMRATIDHCFDGCAKLTVSHLQEKLRLIHLRVRSSVERLEEIQSALDSTSRAVRRLQGKGTAE